MKNLKLLSVSERQDKHCYFCGTNAKYIFESDKPKHFPKNDIPIPAKVYVCNKCAFEKYVGGN